MLWESKMKETKKSTNLVCGCVGVCVLGGGGKERESHTYVTDAVRAAIPSPSVLLQVPTVHGRIVWNGVPYPS
jgi:hypothetical protein